MTATAPASVTVPATGGRFEVRITNTSKAPAPATTGHPGAPAAAFASDVYRVSVAVTGVGWTADVQNALVAVRDGASATVPVFVGSTGAGSARVTVTVASESDATAAGTAVTTVRR